MSGLSGEAVIGVEWLLLGITFFLVLARLNLRLRLLQKQLLLSDYLVLAAFMAGVAMGTFDIVFYTWGVYQPGTIFDHSLSQSEVPRDELIQVLKLYYITYLPFYAEQYLTKASLLALFFEIFPRDSRKLRTSLVCLGLYCAASFIIAGSTILFHCPWGCYWSLDSPCPTQCTVINDQLAWALHFSCDISIFILPLVYLYQTKISTAQKFSASATFLLGALNLAVSLTRGLITLPANMTDNNAGELISTADSHTGLMIAVLISLRPYVRIWQGADLSSHRQEGVRELQKPNTIHHEKKGSLESTASTILST